MGNRLAIAALCAMSIPMASAEVQALSTTMPEQHVVLRAIVDAGTTSVCGMREAPHLIEHLVLSDTQYGQTPVDAILTLRTEGIKLSALTHSDFTEFTLEGPASKADQMGAALLTFLSRPSIPKMGFEREKRTITNEVKAGDSFVSSPTLYERFIAANAGGRLPCHADPLPFLSYDYDAVQDAYARLYAPENIRLIAQAAPGTFNMTELVAALSVRKAVPALNSQDGSREPAESQQVTGRPGLVELIFPISGRAELPKDAAEALADQARLELQAHIRRSYQLYTARSFVDQSINGGWIRLEVPELDNDKAPELMQIAKRAMASVNVTSYGDDPVWLLHGSHYSSEPVKTPLVAEIPPANSIWSSWLARVVELGRSLWSLVQDR